MFHPQEARAVLVFGESMFSIKQLRRGNLYSSGPFVNKTSPAPEFGHIYGVDSGVNGDKLVLTGDYTIRFYKLG